ncbi:MAG: hypothetical protein AB1467_05470 [Candidatus Diapherotrites archaeon]
MKFKRATYWEKEKKEYGKAVEATIEFIRKSKITTIVHPGISASPFAFMIREKWKQLHPNYEKNPPPKFYVLGELHKKFDLRNEKYYDSAKEYLGKRWPGLLHRINEPILFLDDFMASGKTFSKIKGFFVSIGAKDMKSAVFSLNPSLLSPASDFYWRKGPEPAFRVIRDSHYRKTIYSKKLKMTNLNEYRKTRKESLRYGATFRKELRKAIGIKRKIK